MKNKLIIILTSITITIATFMLVVAGWVYFSLNSKKGFSSNYVNSLVVEEFNNSNKYIKIDLKNIRMSFLKGGSALGLEAQKLLVYKQKEPVAQFDNVKISLSIWDLILGEFPARKIDVDGGKVIYHNNTELSEGFNPQEIAKYAVGSAKVVFDGMYELQAVNLTGVDFQYSDNLGNLLVSRSLNLGIKKTANSFEVNALGAGDFKTAGNKIIKTGNVSLNSSVKMKDQNLIDVELELEGIDKPFDVNLKTTYNTENDYFDGVVSTHLTDSSIINQLGFIKEAKIIKDYIDMGSLSLELKTTGYHFEKGGEVDLVGQVEERTINGNFIIGKDDIKTTIAVNDVDEKILKKYWVDGIEPDVRDWVLANISGVYGAKAKFVLNKNDYSITNPTADITLKDAVVNYYDGLPLLTVKKATAKFTGSELNINVDDAYMKVNGEKVNIKNGKVDIIDRPKDVILKIDTNVKINTENAIWFLTNKHIDVKLPMKELYNIKGSANGKLNLGVNITNETIYDYKYSGEITNIKLAKIDNFNNLSSPKIDLKVNPQSVAVAGSVAFNNGSKGDFNYNYNDKTETSKIKYNGKLDQATLHNYTDDKLIKFNNSVNVDLDYTVDKDDNKKIILKSDLTKSLFEILPVEWKKESLNKSSLRLDINSKPSGFYNAYISFNAGGKTPINVNMSIGGDEMGLRIVDTKNIKYGDGNLTVKGKRKDGVFVATVKGRNFYGDVIRQVTQRLPSAKKSQKYKVDVDIKNIKTFDGNLGSRLWGSIHSNGKKYDLISMRLTMVRPSARTFLYYNKKKLRFYSEDISSAYSMLSGTNPTKGGRIGMVGDVDEKGIIKGNVSLTDINVLDVPESTRLLKLFSVVGIFDALQSKTLEFKSIRGKFSLKDGVYSTENISALGKTIAVSAKGNININDSTLDLKGMILPSYKLGSVIKDIPIIGQIISGADGQGPITQKYTAKGTFEDYEVKVDSTGLFTLGILRNVFDVFTSSDEVPVIFDDEQSSNENQED